jgi:CubicO group peptidase (beta-lactamase class C family)
MHPALADFDEHLQQAGRSWNAPGASVSVLQGDALVFRGSHGWRDWGARLPWTADTLFPIASNTKLFTAIAAGLLVQEGRLSWDRPIREAVPALRFATEALDNAVTLRDMLAHRTGIHRHDYAWSYSPLSTRELFERVRYLKPVEPLRQSFIYNNLMYAAVGHAIELVTGEPWTALVRRRLLDPLGMADTFFSEAEVAGRDDFIVRYHEHRDSTELLPVPREQQMRGAAPAGGMVSTQADMARWLAMLMNDGRHGDRQVVPPSVLHETLRPAVSQPNTLALTRDFWEILNPTYGMGRHTASYRGHLVTFHGGSISNAYSQVAYLPRERVGVVTFVIGSHCQHLRDTLVWNVFDRVLGLEPIPWDARWQEVMGKNKKAMTEARRRAGTQRVPGTRAAHALADYAGSYEHPLYGPLRIEARDDALWLDFRGPPMKLHHVHYERFDSDDDPWWGQWSLNFATDALGDVASITMSLDEGEFNFARKPPRPEAALLENLAGMYRTAGGLLWEVAVKDSALSLVFPGQPDLLLVPYKGLTFRMAQHSDRTCEFVMEAGEVRQLKITGPEGEYLWTRYVAAGT